MHELNTALRNFFAWTAWSMEKPPAYGAFHLVFTFVGLAVSILAARMLRKIGDRGNRILLISCGVFLLVCEVYKQLFYYYYIGDEHYQWWIFPFQMCSVPMYLCIIAPLLKPGKVQQAMYNFMMLYNLLGGFMAFVEPSGIVHEYWTLTLHAFIWHMSLVFIGLYLAISNRGGKQMEDYRSASYTFVALCVIAFCINLALREVSGGSVNMFFVGPSNSSLIVFKQISEAAGWYVSTLLYIPVVCLGSFLIFLPFHLYHKKRTAVTA
ncbi:MAG: YwaF family protein [Oscillospiraceae bacterium]|nr:YwaF family protein [Oscillospiraceae bacterium]